MKSVLIVLFLSIIFWHPNSGGQTPGMPISAIDVNNLRSALNTKLTSCSQPAKFFIDTPLFAGTPIKAVHLIELRTGVNDLYATQLLPAPTFTDPAITALSSPIKAVHFNELSAMITGAVCLPTTCPLTVATWTVGVDTCTQNLPVTGIGATATVSDVTSPATGSATFRCNIGGIWASTSVPEPAPSATCSSPPIFCPAVAASWVVGSNTCTQSLPATSVGATATISDSTSPTTGSATFRCNVGGIWASTSVPEPIPAASCSAATNTIACSNISPNPMSKPGGWGTPSMPFSGFITGSFTAGLTGVHTLNVVSNHLRQDLSSCLLVDVVVLDGATVVASDTYPKLTWPGYTANCEDVGGSGFTNVTSTINFSATAGITYTLRFYYRKVTPGIDRNAWSWSNCN